MTNDDYDAIDNGDFSKFDMIGNIFGCLILGEQIVNSGEHPHNICDDVDGDLEYTISALSDPGEPLDDYLRQNIFYIHEFTMSEGYSDMPLKSRILEELPHICLVFYHVQPDILAFYPAPLDYEVDKNDEALKDTIRELARQKLENGYMSMIDPENENKNNTIGIGTIREFSEDEMNIIMRRRRPGQSYPESAKDTVEFEFYEANGFQESGNSRLLFKMVED